MTQEVTRSIVGKSNQLSGVKAISILGHAISIVQRVRKTLCYNFEGKEFVSFATNSTLWLYLICKIKPTFSEEKYCFLRKGSRTMIIGIGGGRAIIDIIVFLDKFKGHWAFHNVI